MQPSDLPKTALVGAAPLSQPSSLQTVIPAPERWLSALTSRGALIVHLTCLASFFGSVVIDVVMVKAAVSCEVYTTSSDARELWTLTSLGGAGILLLLRLAAFGWLRRLRLVLVWTAILVTEIAAILAAIHAAIDVTLFYCAFHGTELSPCLFGCAH